MVPPAKGMGILASIFSGNDDDVFFDFSNCKPAQHEEALHEEVNEILQYIPAILQSLVAYEGCGALIQKALNNNTAENENAAFQEVKENVVVIQQYYNFAKHLEVIVPKLLSALAAYIGNHHQMQSNSSAACGSSVPANDKSSQQAALVKQLGEILDFALKFDEIKMTKPYLQNDFSFYRRLMPKRHIDELIISDEEANFISLFLAEHIPMMKVLIKVLSALVVDNEHVLTVLSAMANACASMVSTKRFASQDLNIFCLRAMAGAIVLFDHVDMLGAFRKKSPLHIKRCLTILTKSPLDIKSAVAAVRYSTKHFNDDDTEDALKELFD